LTGPTAVVGAGLSGLTAARALADVASSVEDFWAD